MGSFKASAAVTAHLRSNPLMDVGDEVFNIDQSQTDRKELGAGTRVDGKVKQQLENLYTGQYDPSKRKKKQRQFDKVNKQTSNLTSLKFDQMRIADGLIPENIQVYFLSIDSWGWSSIIAASLTGGKPLRCTIYFRHTNFFKRGAPTKNNSTPLPTYSRTPTKNIRIRIITRPTQPMSCRLCII